MITVVNWAAYQQSDDDAHHTEHHAEHHSETEDATRETPHRTPRAATLSKEVKNSDKKYKSNSGELDPNAANHPPKLKPTTSSDRLGIDPAVREWFDAEFWPIYPRHEGKQPALKAANAKAITPEKRAFYLGRLKSQLPAYLQRKSEGGSAWSRWAPLGSARNAPTMNLNFRSRMAGCREPWRRMIIPNTSRSRGRRVQGERR